MSDLDLDGPMAAHAHACPVQALVDPDAPAWGCVCLAAPTEAVVDALDDGTAACHWPLAHEVGLGRIGGFLTFADDHGLDVVVSLGCHPGNTCLTWTAAPAPVAEGVAS